MNLINVLRGIFYRHLINIKWHGIFMLLLGYFCLAWIMLYIANEQALIQDVDFFYWIIVTASTVGYGDLSPATPAGKLIASVFVIPFGLSMFAMVIGRIAVFSADQWKKGIRGLKMVNVKDHILVIGWNGLRTVHLLKLLLAEAKGHRRRTIVLCTTVDIENPLPDDIQFVHTTSFKDDQEMDRASISKASCIIINSSSDDLTMSSALYANSRNKKAHIIVYFSDDSLSALLKSHCPNIECMPSVSVEMQAKSAMDPGSSLLHQELLSAHHGMTQFSTVYPEHLASLKVKQLFSQFKQHYDATLIAISSDHKRNIVVNPSLDTDVIPGSTLYYIAKKRISDIAWET